VFYLKLSVCLLLLVVPVGAMILVPSLLPDVPKSDPLTEGLSAITVRHAHALDDLHGLPEAERAERYKEMKASYAQAQAECYRKHGRTPPRN